MIGIGIDAVDIGRFRALMERRPEIVARLFTPAEQAYARRYRDPTPSLAARFAAKEAVMKALGVGLGAFGFREVEVVRIEDGRPSLVLTGGAAALAARSGVARWRVSLTHTDSVAEAVVAALA